MTQIPDGRLAPDSAPNGDRTACRLWSNMLGRLSIWLAPEPKPTLTPEQEDERWRLLSACGF